MLVSGLKCSLLTCHKDYGVVLSADKEIGSTTNAEKAKHRVQVSLPQFTAKYADKTLGHVNFKYLDRIYDIHYIH
jgi:hypothetical protein